jgi:hypothetical protein
LNSLVYELPVGFARFVLEAMNPNVSDLSGEQLDHLASLVGSQIRTIPAHS